MLEKLTLKGLEINPVHVSTLDVYCDKQAKRNLETGYHSITPLGFFARITQIVIGPAGQTNPVLLPDYQLLERNEFYGIFHEGNRVYFPAQALGDLFKRVFMDTDIQLPELFEGESQIPKHVFLKPVWHRGQNGTEFQLEFGPDVAIDLTQKLRDYLPAELLKGVTKHYRTPEPANA